MQEYKEWQSQAIALANTGTMSWRDIASMLGKSKSTVSDFLRKYESFKSGDEKDKSISHLIIPDTQVKPGVDLSYLKWIGKYIVRKRPDVIIQIGDFNDLESLSSYDKGKRSAEGKRLNADIEAGKLAMRALLTPLLNLQAEQIENDEEVYKPRLVLTLGNHEHRLTKHIDANPELHGFLRMEDLGYEYFGWEVYPFLEPVCIDGINYCHYYPNVMTGKALGGNAQLMLKTIGESFTMGHRQTLDVATRFLPASGQQQWGLICGACYTHEEDYKGYQGNHHWRGIVVKHNVKDGSYDPLFVSLDWLKKEYGDD